MGKRSNSTHLIRVCATTLASLLATTPSPPLDAVAQACSALPRLIGHSHAAVVKAGCSALCSAIGICSHTHVTVRLGGAAAACPQLAGPLALPRPHAADLDSRRLTCLATTVRLCLSSQAVVLEMGVGSHLVALLGHPDQSVRPGATYHAVVQ